MTPNNATAPDYVSWATDAADKWAAHAQNVATKIANGAYTTADAAQDWGQCMAIGIESWSGYVSMMAQCLSGGGITTAFSRPFFPENAPTQPMGLTIKASLTAQSGDVVPDSDVTFNPSTLTPQVYAFTLSVPTAGRTGGAYFGTVTTVPAQGSNDVAEDIKVSILI